MSDSLPVLMPVRYAHRVPILVRCKARWEGDARCEKVTGHAGNHKFLTPAKSDE